MPARVAVNGEVEEGISRATDDESAATDGFARVLPACSGVHLLRSLRPLNANAQFRDGVMMLPGTPEQDSDAARAWQACTRFVAAGDRAASRRPPILKALVRSCVHVLPERARWQGEMLWD